MSEENKLVTVKDLDMLIDAQEMISFCLLNILIDKGIITREELNERFDNLIDLSAVIHNHDVSLVIQGWWDARSEMKFPGVDTNTATKMMTAYQFAKNKKEADDGG